jgi:hypothetical protein
VGGRTGASEMPKAPGIIGPGVFEGAGGAGEGDAWAGLGGGAGAGGGGASPLCDGGPGRP